MLNAAQRFAARLPVPANDAAPHEALLRQWGDVDAMPRVIVGAKRELLWSNGAAARLLAAGEDVLLDDGQFKLRQAGEAAGFEQFLAEASAEVTAWCSAGESRPMVFLAWRIETVDTVATGLLFHACDESYRPRWADFSRPFGLTPAETRISMRLLDGLRVEEIALESGISVGTARLHVRNVYGKLTVHSREAMFRLLAPFQIA